MVFAARTAKFIGLKKNAVLEYGVDIPEYSSQFVHYVADNVVHPV